MKILPNFTTLPQPLKILLAEKLGQSQVSEDPTMLQKLGKEKSVPFVQQCVKTEVVFLKKNNLCEYSHGNFSIQKFI